MNRVHSRLCGEKPVNQIFSAIFPFRSLFKNLTLIVFLFVISNYYFQSIGLNLLNQFVVFCDTFFTLNYIVIGVDYDFHFMIFEIFNNHMFEFSWSKPSILSYSIFININIFGDSQSAVPCILS